MIIAETAIDMAETINNLMKDSCIEKCTKYGIIGHTIVKIVHGKITLLRYSRIQKGKIERTINRQTI